MDSQESNAGTMHWDIERRQKLHSLEEIVSFLCITRRQRWRAILHAIESLRRGGGLRKNLPRYFLAAFSYLRR